MPALLDWMKKAARRTLDHRPASSASSSEASSSSSSSSSSSAAAADPPPSSSVTDRYENHGELARGGMGAILKVVDKTLRRPLAMKILEPEDGRKDAARRGLFLEEAQITSQLDHPNICPIHEYGNDAAGTNYFTMKIVRGRTLTELLHAPDYDPADPRSLRTALDALRPVCDALAFAHARGVLHRDLKPDNIMIGDFGQVYLMDWGVAHLLPDDPRREEQVTVSRQGASATDGAIVGTLMYMPPEQARGGPVDVRSDVFGVGAILYEILTQVPPYYAENVGDLVVMAQGAAWRAPQEMCGSDTLLPAALCAICERAMSRDPEKRYQSIPELKAALDEFLVGGMRFPTQTIPAGECVVVEGQLGDTAYVIQRGWCRVFKHQDGEQVAFADLGPGDVFGEAAVFAAAPRTATIQALTEVTVQVVSRDVFEKDLGMASAMGAFVKALAGRFVTTDQQLRLSRQETQYLRAELQRLTSTSTSPAATPAAAPAPEPEAAPPEPPPTPAPPLWPTNPPVETRAPTPTKRWSPTPTKMKQRELPTAEPLPETTTSSKPSATALEKAAPPPVPLPPPVALPPLPAALPLSPLALLESAMKLQALSRDPAEVGPLLIEALVRGTEALVKERARATTPPA